MTIIIVVITVSVTSRFAAYLAIAVTASEKDTVSHSAIGLISTPESDFVLLDQAPQSLHLSL